jgi:hypothetical protein
MALTDILKDIANAIRAKNGEETQYKPSEMAAAIGAISGGGADFSELESKLSNGYTDYSYYFHKKASMTEAPAEILKHTGSGTNFAYMFYYCGALTASPSFDVSNGTNFEEMFRNNFEIITIPPMDTSNGIKFNYMLSGCKKLTTIGGIDFSNATSATGVFNNNSALENITINGVIKITGLSVYTSNNLTHDSLMSFVNALYDWKANGGTSTYTLTLGSTNLAKLTDAEKAIATEKGWTLA